VVNIHWNGLSLLPANFWDEAQAYDLGQSVYLRGVSDAGYVGPWVNNQEVNLDIQPRSAFLLLLLYMMHTCMLRVGNGSRVYRAPVNT
jgi:hypothetical protein